MTAPQSIFGQTLRSRRELRGLSRKKLAELGQIHVSYLSRLEGGSRQPSREIALLLGEILQVNGPELDQWLVAAGFAPIPLLGMIRGAARARGGTHHHPVSPTVAPPLYWAHWLESLGLEEVTIGRLLTAMENVNPEKRHRMAEMVSGTFATLTRQLETKVRLAVIPAAKENRLIGGHIMDRMILRSIGEAASAGISDIILVLAPHKEPLFATLKEISQSNFGPPINLQLRLQASADGLGDALLQAEELVGDNSFAVLLPDDVIHAPANIEVQGRTLSDMITAFDEVNSGHLLAVTNVNRSKFSQYGVVVVRETESRSKLLLTEKLIEKPKSSDLFSLPGKALGVVGRYVLRPSVFTALRKLQEEGVKPLDLTTALEAMREAGELIHSFELQGVRSDVGEVLDRAAEMIETATKGSSKS